MLGRAPHFLLTVTISAASLLAQTEILPIGGTPPPHGPGGSSTRILRTVMRPSSEVPPANINGSAPVTIRIHRANAQPAYSVDFIVDYNFNAPVTITGLHIHRGEAGVNGPIVIESGIAPSNPRVSETGSGSISVQASGTTTAELSALLADIELRPGAYYVNIHTSAYPAGAMRGQLAAAQQTVVMGLMSPANEVPAITGLDASAVGTVVATVTRDAAGAISTAEVLFDLDYRFPTPVTLTGFHIHPGAAGTNGSIVLNSGLTQRAVDAAGRLRLRNELDVTQPQVVAALEALFTDPSGYYLNVHTTTNTGGAMRAQLARASRTTQQVGLGVWERTVPVDPSLLPFADGQITWDVLRTQAGNIAAAMVTFDLNYKNFKPDTELTSVSAGPTAVTFNPAKTVSAAGMGNLYETVTVSSPAELATLERTLQNLTGGVALRARDVEISGTLLTGTLNIAGRLSLTSVESAAAWVPQPAAPGALISIFGTFPVNEADVTRLAQPWPTSLNGAYVTIGGRRIPLGYISRRQINAQIPPDLPPGPQTVQFWIKMDGLSSSDYRSAPLPILIVPQAPAVFVSPQGALITHADGSLITASRPALAGELIQVYATGIAPSPAGSFQNVRAEVGFLPDYSVAIPVESTLAAPGLQGVEIVAIRVPLGLVPGATSLRINVSGTPSNIVPLWIE